MPDELSSRVSPLESLSHKLFEGKTFPRERTVTVGTTRVLVLENNPNRLAWHIINESVNDIRVSNDGTITTTSGWLLNSLGGIISMQYYDDGEVTGNQVFAIAGVAGNTIRVREVLRL